ncbi:hypothetical protein ACLOJK_032730 [Asimina triloba]
MPWAVLESWIQKQKYAVDSLPGRDGWQLDVTTMDIRAVALVDGAFVVVPLWGLCKSLAAGVANTLRGRRIIRESLAGLDLCPPLTMLRTPLVIAISIISGC